MNFSLDSQNFNISRVTGSFIDKDIERQFQESYLNRTKNSFRKAALTMGIFFSMFFVYDLLVNESVFVTATTFICRLTFLALSLLVYFRPDYFFKAFFYLKITIYEVLFIIIFYIIVLNHENPHFIIQAFAINVIILIILFVIPNLLLNKLLLSLVVLITFLGISVFQYHPTFLEVISVFVYVSLTIIIGGISSYNLGKYMKLDFINKQYLIELSNKDPLTKIYNRLKFNESLGFEIEKARRYKDQFSIIMFDVDNFKSLNDEYGHIFGDNVIIEMSEFLQEYIRDVDIFARWGGEEFVILLPQTECKDASSLAERLRHLIYHSSLQKDITLTCSFGVTSFRHGDNADSIMERVDNALYKAKENGRNTVVTDLTLD